MKPSFGFLSVFVYSFCLCLAGLAGSWAQSNLRVLNFVLSQKILKPDNEDSKFLKNDHEFNIHDI